jgi:hypothetical protein
MRVLRSIAAGILCCCAAFSQSARVLTRGEKIQIILNQPYTQTVPPIWSGRALLVLIVNETREPVLNAITGDGLTEEVRFQMPDWPHVRVVSLWGGDDGEIVAAGSGTTDQNEPGSFIVRISAGRAKRTYIPVENLNIQAMTVGPGGVIWAVGSGKNLEDDSKHDNILTRFSPTGKVLTSTMLKFAPDRYGVNVASGSRMRSSADRVAWLTNRNEYIEFATDGTVMTRVAGPGGKEPSDMFSTAFAVSAANTALVSKFTYGKDHKPPKLNIWTLDRVKQNWFLSEPSDEEFPYSTSICGFDGDTLMTSGFERHLGALLVRYTLSETK